MIVEDSLDGSARMSIGIKTHKDKGFAKFRPSRTSFKI